MALSVSPCGWLPDAPCASGPCCPDIDDPINAAIKAIAQQIATAVLWRLTGMRFGCCEITVRPCKPRTCDPTTLSQVIFWDQRITSDRTNMGVLSFFPTLVGGEVFNISCGCPTGCCTCEADCEVRLPGPVCEVIEVVKDGAIVPDTDWMVLDGRQLVFQNDTCPGCQNYNLDSGEVGTWSVKYSVGTPVPDELNFAAGLYACEIAKSLVGDKSCALPARVQSVSRPGTNIKFLDVDTLIEKGLTGLQLVDQIITALNPYGLREPSRVWYPGMPKTRRQTQ